MAALTPDAIELQETWRHRAIPLGNLGVQRGNRSHELSLTVGPEPAAEVSTLSFNSAKECEYWWGKLRQRLQDPGEGSPIEGRRISEGVSLIRRAPNVPHQAIGWIEYTGTSGWAADRGLQLRAAIRGADAVFSAVREKRFEQEAAGRTTRGLAVRVEDPAIRPQVRGIWYAEEVARLVNRLVILVIIISVLLFLYASYTSSTQLAWGLEPGSGETPSEMIRSAGLLIALFGAWPLLLLLVLRVLRWPQLLRSTGLAVLALTTGRGIAVWLGHALAFLGSRVPLSQSKLWILFDPGDWAIVIAGAILCRKAWNLASESRQMLPSEPQAARWKRAALTRGLLGVTVVYGLLLVGYCGKARFEASTHLFLPGVDPRREQEAFQAQTEGWNQLEKKDLNSAERSLKQALRVWDGLTAGKDSPAIYRVNLAWTLNNLGWIHQHQGRGDEAEKEYSRALGLADGLAGDPQNDGEFQQVMTEARSNLVALREARTNTLLNEKHRSAVRKYEEAEIKVQKGEADAESLFQEAIVLWEELIEKTDNEEYRKSTVSLLASACVQLGELEERLGKLPAAEASLKKGIKYGEKAVAASPDRPLPRHTLEVAHETLENLHEQEIQDRLERLLAEKKFNDAAALFRERIGEDDRQLRSAAGKEQERVKARLAQRLDRFSFFMAFCPDRRLRSLREAINLATRATQLQPDVRAYWYTLGHIQYRDGKYHESLASLGKLKAMEGGFGASAQFLRAMALYRLNQGEEARTAYRQGILWIEEKRRQAASDDMLRFQLETALPSIEGMRQEAEALIEGKTFSGREFSLLRKPARSA
jgi:tetratricopeptide (TPR) repeat protein